MSKEILYPVIVLLGFLIGNYERKSGINIIPIELWKLIFVIICVISIIIAICLLIIEINRIRKIRKI